MLLLRECICQFFIHIKINEPNICYINSSGDHTCCYLQLLTEKKAVALKPMGVLPFVLFITLSIVHFLGFMLYRNYLEILNLHLDMYQNAHNDRQSSDTFPCFM